METRRFEDKEMAVAGRNKQLRIANCTARKVIAELDLVRCGTAGRADNTVNLPIPPRSLHWN
jgi:hypothetical protein